jgi:hypothetical protein
MTGTNFVVFIGSTTTELKILKKTYKEGIKYVFFFQTYL